MLVIILFCLASGSGYPQSSFQGRASLYGVYDANVAENPDGSSSAGKNLYFSSDWKIPLKKISSTSVLSGQFKSQNFLYFSNTRKSRSMNQLNLRYSVNASGRFAIQPLFKGEIKHYLDDPRNYRVFGTGFSTLMTTRQEWIITTEVTRTKVFFPSNRQFNNLSDIISLMIRVPLLQCHFIQASVFAGNHRYSKSAVNRQYARTSYQQRDNTFGAGLGTEWFFRNWLAHLYYNFHSVYSNSYGSSFSYHKIECMVLKKIGRGMFLKLYGSTQKRNYHDRVASADISSTLVGVDFQSAIAELGKRIGDDYEIKARLQWYRNQVLFTGLYYNRTVFSVGIEKEL